MNSAPPWLQPRWGAIGVCAHLRTAFESRTLVTWTSSTQGPVKQRGLLRALSTSADLSTAGRFLGRAFCTFRYRRRHAMPGPSAGVQAGTPQDFDSQPVVGTRTINSPTRH